MDEFDKTRRAAQDSQLSAVREEGLKAGREAGMREAADIAYEKLGRGCVLSLVARNAILSAIKEGKR